MTSALDRDDEPTEAASSVVPLHPDPEVDAQVVELYHRPPGCWWGYFAAHGGAGSTTLATVLGGGFDLDRRHPAEHGYPALPVVVVCRSHRHGLEAAQQAAAAGQMRILGLAIMPDAPGRLTKGLKEFAQVTAGGYASTWMLSWVPAWREGLPADDGRAPSPYLNMLRDIVTTLEVEISEATQ